VWCVVVVCVVMGEREREREGWRREGECEWEDKAKGVCEIHCPMPCHAIANASHPHPSLPMQ
jgi:hypothetical protein